MKTISKFLLAFVAIALLGVTASCNKDDNNSDNGGNSGSGYATQIVGVWNVDEVLNDDGQNLYSEGMNMTISISSNGTGLMTAVTSQGLIQGPFSWSVNGNNFRVMVEGVSSPYDYTIVSVSATELVFTSKVLDLPGYAHMQGNFRWHLNKAR